MPQWAHRNLIFYKINSPFHVACLSYYGWIRLIFRLVFCCIGVDNWRIRVQWTSPSISNFKNLDLDFKFRNVVSYWLWSRWFYDQQLRYTMTSIDILGSTFLEMNFWYLCKIRSFPFHFFLLHFLFFFSLFFNCSLACCSCIISFINEYELTCCCFA